MNHYDRHEEAKAQVEAAYRAACPDDPFTFIRGLKIPAANGPQLFSSCMADFQKQCLQEISPNLVAVRNRKKPERRRFWWERTKGASKDSDIAACLLWLLAFSKDPVYIQAGAADKDQAGIIKHRMEDLLHYNPWLRDMIQIHNYEVKSTNGPGHMDILAADIAGSHGETPDILVINELSHVRKWEFIENLWDNALKVPQGIIIVATNAGFRGTKAEVRRKTAQRSVAWNFHTLDHPAPWISQEDLDEAKENSSGSRYMRLWWGKWASGKGDALDDDVIDRIFKSELSELQQPEPGWRYIGGLDLGVKHDHAGLVIAGVHTTLRKIRVVNIKSFVPEDGEVDLEEVEAACFSLGRAFRVEWFGYDPHQAKLMAQRLARRGLFMREVSFNTKSLGEMAEGLMQVVKNGTIESFEDDRLRRDFGKFNIVEKTYGHRLEAVSDEFGHADVGTALVILIPHGILMLSIEGMLMADDDIAFDYDDRDLTEAELRDMPMEFREILEGEAQIANEAFDLDWDGL